MQFIRLIGAYSVSTFKAHPYCGSFPILSVPQLNFCCVIFIFTVLAGVQVQISWKSLEDISVYALPNVAANWSCHEVENIILLFYSNKVLLIKLTSPEKDFDFTCQVNIIVLHGAFVLLTFLTHIE